MRNAILAVRSLNNVLVGAPVGGGAVADSRVTHSVLNDLFDWNSPWQTTGISLVKYSFTIGLTRIVGNS
jgi:hypothetical protein